MQRAVRVKTSALEENSGADATKKFKNQGEKPGSWLQYV